MPQGESKGSLAAGAMSFSALVLAALAILGITRAPAPNAARPISLTTPPSESSASSGPAAQPPTAVALERAYHPGPDEKLATLEPLRRYHASRLAQLPPQRRTTLAGDAQQLVTWLLGGPGPSEASSREPVDFLVAIVPDPLVSGSTFRYDHAINGLSLALGSDGYLLDNFRIDHWLAPRTQASSPKPDPAAPGGPPSGIAVDPDLRSPASILFRRTPRPEYGDAPNLLVVLLVAESPIRGVHAAMLHSTLDLALQHAEQTRGVRVASDPLARVVGPNFSGSSLSLSRALEAWLAANRPAIERVFPEASPVISLINGVALSINPEGLEQSLTKAWPHAFRFRSVVYSSVDLNHELFTYLLANALPGSAGNKIAYLTEESTGFGHQVRPQPSPDADVEAALPFEMVFYSYPSHVSEIRRRYARQATATGDGAVQLESQEKLKFAFDEGADTPELIPIQSPAIISAYDELRLLDIAEDINTRVIRFAWITATDIRDTLFVSEFLHEHCPNLQFVSINLDTAVLHHERISKHRGTLFASTYPLWSQRQVPGLGSPLDREPADLRVQTFAEHPTIGTYNAILAHLIELVKSRASGDQADHSRRLQNALVGYRWLHGPASSGPASWISVASLHGFLPVHLGLPGAPREERSEQFQRPVLPGSYRNHIWQPPAPRYLPRKPWTWELSWRRWMNPTSGVTPLIPLALAAASLFFTWLERRTERQLRRESGRSHSPLRHRAMQPLPQYEPLAAAIRADAELSSMRSAMRPTLTPHMWRWAIALTPFVFLLSRNPYAGLIFRPTLHGFALFLAVTALLMAATRSIWPKRVAFATAVTFWLTGFLLTHASSFEPYELMRWALVAALIALFLIVLIRSFRLTLHWQAFQILTETVQSLPLGQAFDRLPPRLTSRFGSFSDAIVGRGDPELESRFDHVRSALLASADEISQDPSLTPETRELARRIAALAVTPAALPIAGSAAKRPLVRLRPREVDATPATGARMARAMITILLPFWLRRDAARAYGESSNDSDSKSTDQSQPSPAQIQNRLVTQADQYLALELVRYLNRHLDLIWRRVTSISLATLLLMAGVNSYPFQPAGRLFVWLMLIVFLAVGAVLFTLLGANSNSLIARVNRLPAHRTVWNLDFFAKALAFIGPMLGLLATLFLGMADVLRLILGPFVR
jgi:hypothetical protein